MVTGSDAAPGEPRSEVRYALAGLLADPSSTAIVTDFDGTLSPIVSDPAAARPLPGARQVLGDLAGRFAVVAVVSGRPGAFLAEHLGTEGPSPGVILVGLYGLEWTDGTGTVTVEPGMEQWRAIIATTASSLRLKVPSGVTVEAKGLAVTVHWRQAPEAEEWAAVAVADEVAQTGLVAHPGRMSLELRPPVQVDKGSVLRRLVGGCTAVCYLGDDLGDLPAFEAVASLAGEGQLTGVTVAVLDTESAPAVAEVADVTVDGPGEALSALAWLAGQAPSLDRG
jgi:trehalose 6-phosphate phosphatase